MSDKWNRTPEGDPAGEQPERPQESGPGRPPAGQGQDQGQDQGHDQRQGQGHGWFEARNEEGGPRRPEPGPDNRDGHEPAGWWSGGSEAKREFTSPAPSEQPPNNWFDGGWDPNRREHPDQPAPTQSDPGRRAPVQPGPGRPGSSQSRPSQSGPSQSAQPRSGPAPSSPWHSAPNQSGPSRPGPNQPGPNQPGPGQSGPPPSATWQSGPAQSGPRPPGPSGPSHTGPSRPDQSGSTAANTWQSGQSGPTQAGPTQSGGGQAGSARPPQSGPASGPGQRSPGHSGPQQSGPEQSDAGQSGAGQSGSAWGTQSWTVSTESSAWQASPPQQPPRQQQTGSAGSYLWGNQNEESGQQSPWSNALPPQQQQRQQQFGPRHAAPPPNQGPQIGPMGQPVQQPPTWQYPPIPIPQPPGGRRRKQKKLSRTLLIGLVVLAVLVVGSGVTLLVRGLGGDEPAAEQTPTAPASESPSQSESPSPAPSTPRGPTADEVVTQSKLYSIGPVAASKCVEPPFAPVTVTAARQYYARLLPCVSRTWWLAMKSANLPYRNPKQVVYSSQMPSPCGIQRGVRAAYCAANETIYLPFAVDNAAYKRDPISARALMLNNFVHEYGHHVQKLTGILAASNARAQKMSANQKLLESRRRELQATCLGAVYLGANAAFIPMNGVLKAKWDYLIAHMGDDYARPRVHDHGNRVSNYQWTIAGYNNKKPDSCNTFTADEVRVN